MKIGESNAAISLLMHQNRVSENINRTSAQIAENTIQHRQKTVDAMIYKVIERQQTSDKIIQVGLEAMNSGRIIDVFA